MRVKNLKTVPHWQRLEYHPFSDLTEFGVGIDAEAVIDHMARNGWDESERVTLYQGKILDGRHKHSCAQKAEVEPLFQEFVGTDAEALEFVRKKLLRQHLDPGQRAMVAAKLATLKVGSNQHPSTTSDQFGSGNLGKNGEGPQICGPSMSREEAAAAMGVSPRSVDSAKLVQEKCIPSIQRAHRVGDVSLGDAAAVAGLPAAKQEKALDAFRLGKTKTLAAWAKKHAPAKPKKPAKATKAEVLDRTGAAVPDSVRDLFADGRLAALIDELAAAGEAIDHAGWARRATGLHDHYGFVLLEAFIGHARDAAESVQLALEALKAGEPYAVCPACGGAKDQCSACRGCGYWPEHKWLERNQP